MPKRTNNKTKFLIDIYDNVKTLNELNETTYEYQKLKTISAELVPQTGSLQRQQADTIMTNVTHKIIVRYGAGKEITKNMQIHFRGHRFEIKYILNPFFKNETLEIFCQELID
ncbi:phage head closure protein [Jeotgalibacillus terrae]|uniref:Phage head closure protein n=1 Tax=Jeotgalibacillus terrae TaxID=587735 RepID=A0ABW5ZEF4_9BACL|nr:phage head closure protein [Jeotgalibacillus terrae]MBM7577672.1 SPP1 family predicted phage head-tail adaptor [Jeotgalibacillus terrae]